VTSPLLEYCD